MTYEQLLDELNEMTDDQLKQPVVIKAGDDWMFPEVVTVVKNDYSDGEEGTANRFAKFQTILM